MRFIYKRIFKIFLYRLIIVDTVHDYFIESSTPTSLLIPAEIMHKLPISAVKDIVNIAPLSIYSTIFNINYLI